MAKEGTIATSLVGGFGDAIEEKTRETFPVIAGVAVRY